MAQWGSGYVTDILYMEGFYASQSPQHLALTSIINGFEPPILSQGFSYCELGCGRGFTSLILAAANPESSFHAVDFNPAHIAHAQSLSDAARISNIVWHERDFAALGNSAGERLPDFDIITLHGVWSWIAPELRDSILRFIGDHLKPGGLVYVSYNARPAWNQIEPVQRLIYELAATIPGQSDHAVETAIGILNRLFDAKIVPERFQDAVKRLTGFVRQGRSTYLAHEYLNSHWQPLYHADVARSLAHAKLDYVGSASLLRNFENLGLSREQISLLDEIPNREFRETIKDFGLHHPFREDVYVRGARRMTETRRDRLLKEQTFCLLRPAPNEIVLEGPNGAECRPDPAAYAHFFRLLEARPHTIGELLEAPGLPASFSGSSVGIASLLIGGRFALPAHKPSAATVTNCRRLNALIEAREEQPPDRDIALASPTLGIGVSISPQDFELFRVVTSGNIPDAAALARGFDKKCRSYGGSPVVNGKILESEDEAIPVLEHDYVDKIARAVPIWRQMQLI